MVTPVSTIPKFTNTSIFYVNDDHSNIANIEKLKSAADQFDAANTDTFTPSAKTDKLKLSSGDFCLGSDSKQIKYDVLAQNEMGIMASALGNHELDSLKKVIGQALKDKNYQLLALNLEIPETSEENKALKKEITKSYIQEVNGTKYGIIGLAPFNLPLVVTHPQEYKDFKVLPLEKTIPLLQSEIDKLQKQGVNKIILLSHVGYESDIQIAQSVEGVDVILGGHTHNLIEGIQEGKNLFYSKKTGAPTIITQAGKDGKYFGVLNLTFDENGFIKSAQNNVNKTDDMPQNLVMKFFTELFFGKPKSVGTINSVGAHGNSLTTENPSAEFIADAMKKELGTEIALVNSGCMRNRFREGTVTDKDIQALSPFANQVCIANISEKDLVNAIKIGAKSLSDVENRPGLMQVSGLKYTTTKTGELKKLSFIDKNSKETPININNPNPNKTYRVAADSFVMDGGNNYFKPDKSRIEKQFDFDKSKPAIDSIQKLNQPVDIKTDGRIQIID